MASPHAAALALALLVPTARPPATPRSTAEQQRPKAQAPKELSASARLARVNALRVKAAQPELPSFPQVLEMRLTPRVPTLENGAQIVYAWDAHWENVNAHNPDGLFWLRGANEYSGKSRIELSIPTEIGKYYVIDCRARDFYWYWDPQWREVTMKFVVGDQSSKVTGKDGHLIHAFVATQSTTSIGLEYRDDQVGSDLHSAAFWGCDLGKAG